jgi:SNF2 family DNA or RNA helicase
VDILDHFHTNPEIRGLFLTYKVGGKGLNLTEATHSLRRTVVAEGTRAVPNQAKARLWRTGQTKVVAICKDKERMAASFLEGTEKPLDGRSTKYTLGVILGINPGY